VKVIQVAGLSGSGKTTFIRALIPLLARLGPVGTVKHVGHHAMELPEGKDTTIMLGAGAMVAAGIDGEKTVVTMKCTLLADALDILSSQGIAVAIIEGYKTSPLPKIALGDVEVKLCILRNPSLEEVIDSLAWFPNYFTLEELRRSLEDESRAGGRPAAMAYSAIPLPERREGEDLPRMTWEIPGVIGVRAVIHRGSLYGRSDELLIAVAAETGEAAATGLGTMIERTSDFR
jgi:molybdopterin-guanine dinucleotide biosynthesis protein MobB